MTFNKTFLDLIDYPSREELEFLGYKEDEFKQNFEIFCDEREKIIKSKIVNLLMDESLN